jgi:hypothetical protein
VVREEYLTGRLDYEKFAIFFSFGEDFSAGRESWKIVALVYVLTRTYDIILYILIP